MTTVTRALTLLASFFLTLMMGIMVLDVILRLVWNAPLFGKVEIVQFLLVLTVYFAMAETFWRDEQVTVDVIDQILPAAAIRFLRLVAALLTVILLVLITWRGIQPALDTLDFGDRTMDLRISHFWYWVPIIFGMGLATLAMLAFLWRLIRSDRRAE